MKIQEITEKFGNLKIFEKRSINDAYAEVVFFTEQLDQWHKILEDFLGPAVKPSGMEPSIDHKNATDALGGIFFNQTLFQKDYDDMVIIAMFWPWQNGQQVTLKIAAIRRED